MTQAITTEMLMQCGCAVFNGKAFDVCGNNIAQYLETEWAVHNVPMSSGAIWVYGSLYGKRPRFRVKAIPQQLQGQ